MRVLLVSEGKHERGTPESPSALETLVRRLSNNDDEYVHDRLGTRAIHSHRGKGKGYYKRAVRWMLEAAKRGFDAIVLLVDEDDKPERRREIDEAQRETLSSINRAFGTAIRSFDAWMLADEPALSNVLGVPIDRQPDIESISNPKQVCEGLLSQATGEMTQTGMYSRVAQEAALETLVERCPSGFAPFAERVRNL